MLPQLLEAMKAVAPNDSTVGAIGAAFDDVAVAEEEVAKAQERHPEHAQAIWETFRSLQRPDALWGLAFELYRAHCAELLDRVATGGDIDMGTKAEVMAMLSNTSLVAPLGNAGTYLYCSLFMSFGMSIPEGMGVTLEDVMEGFRLSHGSLVQEEAEMELEKMMARFGSVRPRSEVRRKEG